MPTDTGDDEAAREVAQLEGELAELADLRGAGTISLAEWMHAREPMQQRLDEARRRAATAGQHVPDRMLALQQRGEARAQWDDLDFETKRAVIQAVVEKVVVAPATRGRWTTALERVDPDNGGDIIFRDVVRN